MISIHCRTNLDLRHEVWPEKLPFVPTVGMEIQSGHKWSTHREPLKLRVTNVTIKPDTTDLSNGKVWGWYVEVELHLPPYFKCISHFEAWYDLLTGQGFYNTPEAYERRLTQLRKEGVPV